VLPKFSNEPYLDFSKPENRESMKKALADLKAMSSTVYDLVIGGKHLKAKEQFVSYNPSDKKPVGTFQKAAVKEAEKAMQAALAAFKTWRYMPAIERAGIVLRASRMMKQRRFEFDAAMILEEGKNWLEADADFAEAVDFLEFYAREAIRYDQPCCVTPYPGESQ